MKIKLLYMASGGCAASALLFAALHSHMAPFAFAVAAADYWLAEFLTKTGE